MRPNNYKLDRKFYTFMAVLNAVVICIGFANTYGRKYVGGIAIPEIVHVHGMVFLTWLLLFIAQTVAVMNGRISLHKKIGAQGMLIALVMLISGLKTGVFAANTGHLGIPGLIFDTPEGFLLLNVASIVIFSLLACAGWYFRTDVEAHKRLMLMATVLALVPPGLSRWPGLEGNVPATALSIFAYASIAPIYDLKVHGKLHKAYKYSLPLIVFILPPVVAAIASTSLWAAIAKLLMAVF